MTFVTKEDLDEFEGRMNVRFHSLEQTLDELCQVMQSQGTMFAELHGLVGRLVIGREKTGAGGPATPAPPLAPTYTCGGRGGL